uniref:HDC06792 n=1 Tax=Drosophila melanogaster TaxID=7227 RepID=Q6IGA8_DROME|nr:TPA_inf: HDC06792 [Drosophila melanogaster]
MQSALKASLISFAISISPPMCRRDGTLAFAHLSGSCGHACKKDQEAGKETHAKSRQELVNCFNGPLLSSQFVLFNALKLATRR